MTGELSIRNRQRFRRVNTRLLRELTLTLLNEEFRCESFEVCIHLIGAREMARINETFLQHEGSTDVITFELSDGVRRQDIAGEIFISVADAIANARQFHTTWQEEVVRYVVHGLLHLRGYDDARPAAHRRMKREENRILRSVLRHFRLHQLARKQ
jgi:rRNA maturation RNase YbeY